MTKKPKSQLRDIIVKAKLTPEEKEQLYLLCASSGLSKAGFIRQALFSKKVTFRQLSADDESLLEKISLLISEYGRIGNNLNQIARRLNSGEHFSEETASLIRRISSELEQLKQDLLKLLGGFYGNHKTHRL